MRNVGESVVESLIATRTSRGRFADFPDFLAKVDAGVCNKRVIESLIKAGAFDSLGHTRKGLLSVHAEAVDAVLETKRAEAVGQFDLFADVAPDTAPGVGLALTIPLGEWEKSMLLAAEREMLGLYVSDHPLFGVEHVLAQSTDCTVAAVHSDDRPDGQVVSVGGLVTAVSFKTTKSSGARWAIVSLEDLEGAIEVMVFPATFATVGPHLTPDAVVIVKGRIDKREEESPRLVALEVTVPDLSEGPRGPVVVTMPAARCTPPLVERLREVLSAHPGVTEVQLRLSNGSRTTLLRLDDRLRVTATPSLFADLKALLGPNCL